MHAEQPRLLVIDDDCILRTTLGQQLDRAGYTVHLAEDGDEGLEATRRLRPEFVVCDWAMPRVDGLEYCRRVRSDPALRSTYVALLSSRTEEQDKVAGLDAGADDFMVKPVGADELLARVRAGLRIRRLQADLIEAEHRSALLEMAATLGHEINNPLTALFGHLELVLQNLQGGDSNRTHHHLREANRIAGRIADVAHRLTALRDPRLTVYLHPARMLDLKRDRN
jgi:DNA-binding response OmpR family regulator